MPTSRKAPAHREPAQGTLTSGNPTSMGALLAQAWSKVQRVRTSHPPLISISSWVVYDVSNTVFFSGVIGVFFPLWVVKDMGGSDVTIGFTVAGAMFANLLVSPVIGAMADGARRRLPFLTVMSLIGISCTLLLGTLSLSASIALFGVALVVMHTGVVIYNALLVEVSTKDNRGLIGSIGVGVGYLGALLTVAIGLTVAEEFGYVAAFRAIGVIMLALTLPIILLLRERPRELRGKHEYTPEHGALGTAIRAARDARHYPGLVNLLVGRFWYYLAVNTASIFAFLYGTETVGFGETKVYVVMGIGIIAAMIAAPVWGAMSDRRGPFATMQIVLGGWLVVLLGAVAIPWLHLPSELYWIVGPSSGIMIAGTWSVDRPLLLQIVPEQRVGQFFGLHSLTGRLGTIVGPAAWGFIAARELWFGLGVGLGLGQTAAVAGLMVAVAFAIYFMSRSAAEVRHGMGAGDRLDPSS